jgi:glycosyltransferase involved in cell wall biosynthesis
LPVYNAEPYLADAIDSILAQTFTDFQLLIIDDGSDDRSLEIARSYSDPRISIERNPRNLGLVATLNRGLQRIRSEYIARMDADDIAIPDRLEKQVAFMDRNPDVGLCGGFYEQFTEHGSVTIRPPTRHDDIVYGMLFYNQLAHYTIIMRRSILVRHDIFYDADFIYAEDYELWTRFARYSRLANIPHILVKYRFHPNSTSSKYRQEQLNTARRVRHIHARNLGLDLRPEDSSLHEQLLEMHFEGDTRELYWAGVWLSKIYRVATRYNQKRWHELRRLNLLWYSACGRSAHHGIAVFGMFFFKPYGFLFNPLHTAKLLFRCLTRKRIPPSGQEALQRES